MERTDSKIDDWPQIKARLEEYACGWDGDDYKLVTDVRAALQRESEQAQALEDTLADYEKAMQEVGALRQRVKELEDDQHLLVTAREELSQRVEELERDRAAVDEVLVEVRKQGSLREIDCANETLRAEAAEAKLAEAEDELRRWRDEENRGVSTKVALLEAKLEKVVEVLERCQCNTGECPCVGMALATAKGE